MIVDVIAANFARIATRMHDQPQCWPGLVARSIQR